MQPPKIKSPQGPEAKIQQEIINFLKIRDWYVKNMHGNQFQFGVPDLYCAHRKYGARWVEVKDPKRKSGVFTAAQLAEFPKITAAGVGIWVLTAATEEQYNLMVRGAPNWYLYLDNLNPNSRFGGR